MKEKLQRFMYGRYGLDSFGKFTIIVSLVLMLLANFVPARLGSVLSLLCWALLIYTYFRMFSEKYDGTEKDTSHLQMSDL